MQKPIIICYNNGLEKWYPSIAAAAKEIGITGEGLRLILVQQRFGKRNRYNIAGIWESDWERRVKINAK